MPVQSLKDISAEAIKRQLFECVESRDIKGVEHLSCGLASVNVAQGVRNAILNGRNDSGDAALHIAALKGDADMIKTLVTCGARVDIRGDGGETPLHRAAQYSHVDAVRALLEKGADLNARDDSGNSALHIATEGFNEGDVSKEKVIEMLAKAEGADVNALGERSKSPLYNVALGGGAKTIQFLVDCGARPESPEVKRAPLPLNIAAANRQLDAVKTLLANRANPNTVDDFSGTAIHDLMENSFGKPNMEIAKELLKAGAKYKQHEMPAGAKQLGPKDIVKLDILSAEIKAEEAAEGLVRLKRKPGDQGGRGEDKWRRVVSPQNPGWANAL